MGGGYKEGRGVEKAEEKVSSGNAATANLRDKYTKKTDHIDHYILYDKYHLSDTYQQLLIVITKKTK